MDQATPMIFSMTAFARDERTSPAGVIAWEIRSVNHRYLEVSFRLPDALRDLEGDLRERARARLKRGKVDCTARLATAAAPVQLEINRPALLNLLALLEQLRRDAPEAANPNPFDLLRWPGVLAEPQADAVLLKDTATAGFDAALATLESQRAREGDAIRVLISERLGEIGAIVAALHGQTQDLALQQRERLAARVKELAVELDRDRLEQEVALLAQRADVSEELDRLRIHVASVTADLTSAGPHGRRLDFLMQELNREANTLASKAVQTETARRAVDLKVMIEQIREQVQNIE
jgi:uncharacterized protein (TIGR00255 family)